MKKHPIVAFEHLGLTMDSVIARHIPDPPPVQKRTRPLKMSSLKTAVESTTGEEYFSDIVEAIGPVWCRWPQIMSRL